MTPFAKFFDRVAIINLPSRPDRLKSVRRELRKLGFEDSAISVPPAPVPKENNGFPSRGVYGNYLSHLAILKDAISSGVQHLLVLEDDAIFSRAARSTIRQAAFLSDLEKYDWAMWFLGHKLRAELKNERNGLLPSKSEFHWAHAYAVHQQSLIELASFLEELMARSDSKMYIDGAFYHYRAEKTPKVCLVSNPPLSIQKGSDSNLAGPAQPGQIRLQHYPRNIMRAIRDEFWRWTDIDFR